MSEELYARENTYEILEVKWLKVKADSSTVQVLNISRWLFPKVFFSKRKISNQIWPRDHMASWSDWLNKTKTTKSFFKMDTCRFRLVQEI